MDAALELDRVSKRYGAVTAVDDLSFTARKGRILGFLGPNGAGKTSTLRMVLGLSAVSAGRIDVLGAPDGRSVRDRIGFLPEERGLYRRMTPVEAIVFLAGLKGVPAGEARRRARDMLQEQGLGEAQNRQIRQLSKGMAQKVQLIAAIVHRPELVILDEPFSGLDPVNQQTLETVIRKLAEDGATVVFSTHVMQHAERLCEHVVLLARGRKAFDGEVAEARASVPRALVLEGALEAGDAVGLPGVASVASQSLGEGLWRHVCALKAGANGQEALKTAFARGLDIQRFDLREPTLHDAFIVLTGENPGPEATVAGEAAA
ncbi:MAG: ABC transporter ATP-binding protein [Caulobacter sp.]|nr:ABC transporter ATP-binding protein [Caulobacter sp.]